MVLIHTDTDFEFQCELLRGYCINDSIKHWRWSNLNNVTKDNQLIKLFWLQSLASQNISCLTGLCQQLKCKGLFNYSWKRKDRKRWNTIKTHKNGKLYSNNQTNRERWKLKASKACTVHTGEHDAEEMCGKVMMKVENATHKPERNIVQQPGKQ